MSRSEFKQAFDKEVKRLSTQFFARERARRDAERQAKLKEEQEAKKYEQEENQFGREGDFTETPPLSLEAEYADLRKRRPFYEMTFIQFIREKHLQRSIKSG